MGTLVAMNYPLNIPIVPGLADHTYVRCGNGGAAWGCFGGKTGGEMLNSGTGSTARADAIAGRNEQAGLKCYLINGVCHQAANRILYPAAILVEGARGYGVSSAMFGTYGRPGRSWLNPCHSPFNKRSDVTGELPACAEPRAARATRARPAALTGRAAGARGRDYLRLVRRAYDDFYRRPRSHVDALQFDIRLFERDVRMKLGEKRELGEVYDRLLAVKENVELRLSALELDVEHSRKGPDEHAEFIRRFNDITHGFQDELANCLSAARYRTMLEEDRDERIVLADPEVITKLFGEEVVRRVYGEA